MQERDLRLEDGRTLHVHEAGGVGGLTVLWHHGTPNVGVPPGPLLEVSERLGLRWVGHDRPGYGGSDPRPGRTVGDVAADAAAVADALDLDRFAVVGHSGGGPHALACAALLPDRVAAVVCVSGLAPRDAVGLDWYAGMAAADVASLRAAEEGRAARIAHAEEASTDEVAPVPADRRALAGRWAWLASVTGPQAGAGLEGLVEDELAFVAPWGFDPVEVAASTLLLHGSADPVVPPATVPGWPPGATGPSSGSSRAGATSPSWTRSRRPWPGCASGAERGAASRRPGVSTGTTSGWHDVWSAYRRGPFVPAPASLPTGRMRTEERRPAGSGTGADRPAAPASPVSRGGGVTAPGPGPVAGQDALTAAVGALEQSSRPSPGRVRALTLAAGTTGGVLLVLGLLVDLGWALDVAVLKQVVPDAVTMKFATATCLALLGAAIAAAARAVVTGRGRWQTVALVLLVPVVLAAIVTLVEDAFGLTSAFDNPFGLDPGDPHTPVPGRMAQMSAVSLLVLSAAIVLAGRRVARASQVLAVIAIATGMTAVVGYAYGVRSLYGVGPFNTMAVHTAAAVVLAGLGVLFLRPAEGYLRVLVGNTAGGVIVRQVLPWVVLFPLVVGAFVVVGFRDGRYDAPFALALFASLIVLAGAALVWFQGERLRDVDLRRGGAEEALRVAQEALAERDRIAAALEASVRRTRRILATAADAYIAIDAGGRVTDWNDAATAVFGWSRTEAVGRNLAELIIPTGEGPAHEAAIRRSAERAEVPVQSRLRELEAVTRSGARIPVELRVWTDQDGAVTGFHAFVRDITERKRAEEDLRALNADLTEFAAVAAHDLRAPLATIRMQVDLLLSLLAARARGEEPEEDPAEWVARIGRTAERGVTLIDELLDYASIGRERHHAVPVALTALAEEVADQQVTDGGRVVTCTVDPLPVVAGDEALLRQLLVNLIGNAIKYVPADRLAEVHVDAVPAPGHRCVLRVTDNGAGFALDEVDHVFEMFRRGRGAGDVPGTGIGLAICRRVAERHGGRIWVETPAAGGSRVCVDLPLWRGRP